MPYQFNSLFTNPPQARSSGLGAGLSAEDDDRFPTFQNAWKDGALFDDMFGPDPFKLHGSVGGSGADNHRPDVAKVETFLGDAGYYKPMTGDGPSGWHNANLDTAIRTFQQDKGLKVDGVLKPNGPTITKLGGLLGGGSSALPKSDMPEPKRDPGSIFADPQPEPQGGQLTQQQQLEALIRILNGGKQPAPDKKPPIIIDDDHPWPKPIDHDQFPDHTINPEGADHNQRYAEALVRDADPAKTADFLKNVIGEYGDQGRGDVADLLGRLHKIDQTKAEDLRQAIHKAGGGLLPFRVAPMGEGFREMTDEEKARLAPKDPFGSAVGADTWEAGNMAKVLLGRGDYKEAITHFQGEITRDRAATMPYLAAVHGIINDQNPTLAAKFASQMQAAGLTEAGTDRVANEGAKGQAPEGTVGGSGTKDDPWVSAGGTAVWHEGGSMHVGTVTPTGTSEGPSISAAPAPGSAPPVFDPKYGDGTRPPEWKKDVFKGQPGAWEGFNKSVDNLPGVTDTEKFVYGQVYAAEGGNDVDPKSQASSGILPSTLEQAKASGKIPGLDKVKSPKDLSSDQRAAVMQWYFDGALRTVGGGKMLDAVGDKAAAAAMADTLYRHGGAGGTELLQKAINKAAGQNIVVEDGKMGAETFNAFQSLSDNPKTRDALLNWLADLRSGGADAAEKARMDHYRPKR